MRLQVYNGYKWVQPFRRIVNRSSRTMCRFCLSTAEKHAPPTNRCDLAYKDIAKQSRIPVGADAIELTTFYGPTGTTTICRKCAVALVKNLQGELDK